MVTLRKLCATEFVVQPLIIHLNSISAQKTVKYETYHHCVDIQYINKLRCLLWK